MIKPMTQGDIIQDIRLLQREARVQDERIHVLEDKVAKQQELLNSPIRRAIHAASQKHE